jgi:hypothetical protein
MVDVNFVQFILGRQLRLWQVRRDAANPTVNNICQVVVCVFVSLPDCALFGKTGLA